MSLDFVTVGVLLLVLLTAGLTLFVVFLVWRNGYVRGWRRARQAAPRCPKCGYNLSGLTHCRCPECGVEYRLEELWCVPLFGQRDHAKPGSSENTDDKRGS